MFLVFQIIAFELVVVNSPYNDENTRHPSAVNVLMCMSIVTFPVVFQPIASCECLHNYCVCVKRCSSPSSCDSASLIWNIGEFGAKNYFTDHRAANTLNGFRDSVPVLKIHGCY